MLYLGVLCYQGVSVLCCHSQKLLQYVGYSRSGCIITKGVKCSEMVKDRLFFSEHPRTVGSERNLFFVKRT